jgi:hypothetical protein
MGKIKKTVKLCGIFNNLLMYEVWRKTNRTDEITRKWFNFKKILYNTIFCRCKDQS